MMARTPSSRENSVARPVVIVIIAAGVAIVGWFMYSELQGPAAPVQETAASASSKPDDAGGTETRVAPPMPYRFAGTATQAGTTKYLLERDGRVLAVSPGMIIDHDYRVDMAGDHDIALVYVPTGERQAVPMSEAPWPPPLGGSAIVGTSAQQSLPGAGSPVKHLR